MKKLKKIEDMDPEFLPQLVHDRRVGMRTTVTAQEEMMKYGFTRDVARALMASFNRMTGADVRGYSKTPPALVPWTKRGRKDKGG